MSDNEMGTPYFPDPKTLDRNIRRSLVQNPGHPLNGKRGYPSTENTFHLF